MNDHGVDAGAREASEALLPPLARREEVLRIALDLASAEGLSGLSIGRLARASDMSKSGLFALFGSKEQLQLAAVEQARRNFERAVIEPARGAEPGLARLRAMVEAWIRSIEDTPNRGGCFFDAASSEFASRPGPVRDRLARLSRVWIDELVEQAGIARRCAELARSTDPELLAFQLHAYVEEANWSRQLFDATESFNRARDAIERTLACACGAPPEETPDVDPQ